MHGDVISHKRMGKCDYKIVQIDIGQLREISLNHPTNL